MVNHVALNSETHRNIRVIRSRGVEYGENIHFVPVIADELRSLVLDYPVCLMKEPETGQFGMYALLGFEPGQNLFLQESRWDANYVPLHLRRQPFLLGVTAGEGEEPSSENTFITVDIDSKRISESEGEALFNSDGTTTAFLNDMHKLLAGLMAGIGSTKAYIDTLAQHDLIEPAQLNITFADGEQKRYDGLYTVNEEKLGILKGDALEQLHSRGYLQASNLLLASLGQVSKLISWKNTRNSAES